MTEWVIEADKLTRRFGDFTAVDAISFKVASGEIFGFLGARLNANRQTNHRSRNVL